MSRPRTPKPKYRLDRRTGRGCAVWKDHAGMWRRRGLPGGYKSPESYKAFEDLKLELKASATGTLPKKPPLTMAGLMDAYLKHAERYYRDPDGKPTSSICHHRIVARSFCELFPGKRADEFGPLCLKAAVQRWVNAKLSRGECNWWLSITKGIFKWAASEELLPGKVYHDLATVPGLRRGRTNARESKPVKPVADAVVDATLPHLNRHLVGMVQLQRLTGMRPGEACMIRQCDIDMSATGPDAVWLYTPERHTTAHKGKSRVIPVGPLAQAVIKPFFTANPDAYLFQPGEVMAELSEKRARERKTPPYLSHMKRNWMKRKKRPRRNPYRCYRRDNYYLAIARACAVAFPPPAPLAIRPTETLKEWAARLTPGQQAELKKWRKNHHWHPNQIRHTFATRVRKQFGVEAARVLLGHADVAVTQIYAERDLTLAAAVAAKIG